VNNRIAAIGSVCSPDHGWYEFGVPPDELQIAEIRKTPAPSPALSTGFPVEDVDFALKRPQRSSLICNTQVGQTARGSDAEAYLFARDGAFQRRVRPRD
jgi:hypothetical protein